MNDLISSLNPFCSKYHALEDFNKLTLLSKLTVIFVTTLASVATAFICTSLVFRLLVGRLKPLDPSKGTSQNDLAKKIEKAAKPVLGQNDVSQNLNLNEETLLHVFSYLDKTSLFNAMQVCKDFRRVGADDTLWKDKSEKTEKELSFCENYLRKKEIAFRIKSPKSKPEVTRLKGMGNTRTSFAYQHFIIHYYCKTQLNIYNTKTGTKKSLAVPSISGLQVYKNLLLVGSIGFIEIFDLDTSKSLKKLEMQVEALNSSPVTDIFVKDEKVIGVFNDCMVIWDLERGGPQKFLKRGPEGKVVKILFHEKYAVTLDADCRLVLWDLETESILDQARAGAMYIFEGKLVKIRFSDSLMTFFDFETKNSEIVSFFSPDDHLRAHQNGVLTWLIGNKFIIKSDLEITVGDLKENKLLFNFFPHQGEKSCEGAKFKKTIVRDGLIITSIESETNPKILVSDLETGNLAFSIPIQKLVDFVVWEEEKVMACLFIDKLEVWDLVKGTHIKSISIPKSEKLILGMPEGKILLDYSEELFLLNFGKEGKEEELKLAGSCTLF